MQSVSPGVSSHAAEHGSISRASAAERILLLALLGLIGALYLWGARYWIDPFEEGYFAYLASRVAAGHHPYQDFATPYTPGFFYLHGALLQLFGPSLVWQRVGVIAARLVGATLLYCLARRHAPPRYALLAPATFLFLDPAPVPWQTHPSWYAAPAATAAALAMLRLIETGRVRWLLIAGGCAALSFAFKQNTGLLTLLALGTFVPWLGSKVPIPRQVAAALAPLDRIVSMRRLVGVGAAFALPLAFLAALRARPYLEYVMEYVLPLVVLNGWFVVRSWRRRERLSSVLWSWTLLAVSFVALTLPWMLALLGAIGRADLPVRQFIGGVDLGGYILDQWWPHPEGLITITLGPALLFAMWQAQQGWRIWAVLTLLTWLGLACAALALVVVERDPLSTVAGTLFQATENANQLLPAAALGLVVLALVRGWGEKRVLGPAWLATFGAAMYFHQFPRMDEPHLIFSLPPAMAALAWFLGRLELRVIPAARGGWTRLGVTAALVAVPLLACFPVMHWRWSMLAPPQSQAPYLRAHEYTPLRSSRADVLVLPYVARPLDDVTDAIQAGTSALEPIFVFPAAPMLYYLADRPNATRFNHFLTGLVSAPQEDEAIRALDERQVKLVVIEPEFEDLWLGSHDYAQLRTFIRSEFKLSEIIGPYEIWMR